MIDNSLHKIVISPNSKMVHNSSYLIETINNYKVL